MGCARFVMLAVNLVFALLGVAFVGLGVYAVVETDNLRDESNLLAALPLKTAGIVLTAVGSVVTLMALCGCTGAVRRSNKCLKMYLTVLTLLVLTQFALAVYLYTQPDKVLDEIEDEWKNDGNFDEVVSYQEWLGCCGFEGVPATTPCDDRDDDGVCAPGSSATDQCRPDWVGNDCRKASEDWLDDHISTIAIVLASLAGLQLFGLLAGCCMVCSGKKETLDQFYEDY